MNSPEIEIGDFQIFVNPYVPEDERKQFEKAMREILSDTNKANEASDANDKEGID